MKISDFSRSIPQPIWSYPQSYPQISSVPESCSGSAGAGDVGLLYKRRERWETGNTSSNTLIFLANLCSQGSGRPFPV
jgi:hypothetical protein